MQNYLCLHTTFEQLKLQVPAFNNIGRRSLVIKPGIKLPLMENVRGVGSFKVEMGQDLQAVDMQKRFLHREARIARVELMDLVCDKLGLPKTRRSYAALGRLTWSFGQVCFTTGDSHVCIKFISLKLTTGDSHVCIKFISLKFTTGDSHVCIKFISLKLTTGDSHVCIKFISLKFTTGDSHVCIKFVSLKLTTGDSHVCRNSSPMITSRTGLPTVNTRLLRMPLGAKDVRYSKCLARN